MYKPHEDFDQIDAAAILWRYQDLPRYLDLLLRQQLFFCKADRFEDPFEGKYTVQAKEELIKDGIKDGMLVTKGYGEEKPKKSNDNPDGKFQNRRIQYSKAK